MKKLISVALLVCLVLSLVACGGTKTPAATEKEYKLGMGVVVSTASSKTGTAQVDATVATIVTDADGKIVACRIDVAQNKMNVADGAVEAEKTFKTKFELKEDYNMAKYGAPNVEGGTVKEWYVQAAAFENYVVGKTAAEVAALETQTVNDHLISSDKALLDAGCTMQITDFMEAIDKAGKDDQAVTFKTAGDIKLGVAAKTTVDSATKAATADAEGVAAMYSDFAATVVDANGKILASLNDAIQPKIAIKADGSIGATTYVGTKRELKENYNMAKYGAPNVEGGTVKEWYVQSAAFSAYVVGKTGAEVAAMETQTVNDHLISTDKALLDAGCTMQITGICAVVAESVNYAR